jgi:carbonic anhydrase/acetyltransferase-like protein (isoleucine patch superfamily)
MDQSLVQRLRTFAADNRSTAFDPAAYTLVYGGLDSAEIEKYGIHVENIGRKSNKVFVRQEPRQGAPDVRVRFFAEGGEVYIDGSTQVRGLVRVHADNCVTIIGGDNKQASPFNITHWSRRTVVVIGRGTSSNGAQLVAMGEGAVILIGDDCMFSTGIWVKTSDMHAMVDLETGAMVNRNNNAGDVEIGRHVWIGQDVLVTHGVRLGSGSIFGAKSLVRESAPDATVWAGVPARQLRENVTWLRAHVVGQAELQEVKASLGLVEETPSAPDAPSEPAPEAE